jgi:hypothetical protein
MTAVLLLVVLLNMTILLKLSPLFEVDCIFNSFIFKRNAIESRSVELTTESKVMNESK